MKLIHLVNATGTGYVVVMTRQSDGHQWLAYGPHGLPSFFERRMAAVKYRDELHNEHGCGKGKVVRVTWAFSDATPRPGGRR